MHCPVDHAELSFTTVDNFNILTCPECKGHWLEVATLQALAEKHHEYLSPADLIRNPRPTNNRICPADGKTLMQTFAFPAERLTVTIDECSECQGLWLDGYELDAILAIFDEEQEHALTLSTRAMLFLYNLSAYGPKV